MTLNSKAAQTHLRVVPGLGPAEGVLALGGLKVLVIEDELLAADAIIRVLETHGMNVVGAAPSVKKALSIVRDIDALDAAIIDVNLAGEMAYPIADALMERGTPFVFATAYDQSRLPLRYRDAPHCPKPMQAPELLQRLAEALSRRRPPANGPALMTGNGLLWAAGTTAASELLSRGMIASLPQRRIIASPMTTLAKVYFPLSGVISITRAVNDGEAVESHLVGREGALGLDAATDSEPSRDWATVTAAGDALVVAPAAFRDVLARHASLRQAVQAYQADLIDELKQRIACGATHLLSQRVAGWLLRCRVRAGSDKLGVTQEHLSQALSTQRTTVTAVARQLKASGILRYSRGHLEIVDWRRLETIACACHREADPFRSFAADRDAG